MPEFRYVEFPDAKVFDAAGAEINHVLFGDWVRVEGPVDHGGWVPVHVRGTTGRMRAADLREERVLEVVFTDVGQGDGCLVVTPRDKHLVIDAGVSDNMFRFLRWRYAGFKKKWTFQAAVLTHPDQDHYEGFRRLFEHPNVHFETVYHNGIMEERGSRPLGPTKKIGGRPYLTGLVRTRAELDAFLADTSRWKQGRSIKQYPSLLDLAATSGRVGDIRMLGVAAAGPPVFLPGYGPDTDLQIEVLGPVVERDNGSDVLRAFGDTPSSKALDAGKTKNGHSVLLMARYGDVRLLFGGDLNTPAEVFLLQHHSGLSHPWPWTTKEEEEIAAAARGRLGCDVAKSCHHGSADFQEAFLKALTATVTVISSGDQESHAHPRPDTLGAIGLHGRGWRPLIFSTELMRSTREHEGSIPIEVGRLRQQLEDAVDEAERTPIRARLDALVDRLLERNVTVYGAINLRTDGRRTVMAYKLEAERRRGKSLTKWDIYPLERAGHGGISYQPRG